MPPSSDFQRWPAIFPEIEKVVVTAKTGDDARVTMIGHDDHHDNLHFHNTPAARMVWFRRTPAVTLTVWLEMVMSARRRAGHDDRAQPLILPTLTQGVASLMVSDFKVRVMREDKLGHDLSALRRYFHAEDTVSQN